MDNKNPETVILQTTFSKQAKWVSDTKVHWHFDNWEPQEDIIVETLKWYGLQDKIYDDFIIPEKYCGATNKYTEDMLEGLVKAEIEPLASIFTEEIKTLDRNKLRSAIANILYHEILARHGYSFIIDKYNRKLVAEQTSVSDCVDGTMLGEWYLYFTKYHLHGGWYQSNQNISREEIENELNDIEKYNLAFLKQYGAVE